MQIVSLAREHEPPYCVCLEDWSDEIKEGGDQPDAIFIDGRAVRMGPPPSYEKIRKRIARRAKKLG
jgi:hypothetical protein